MRNSIVVSNVNLSVFTLANLMQTHAQQKRFNDLREKLERKETLG